MIFKTPFLPADNLSLFMLVMVAFLFPLIFIYSLSYIRRNLFRYYFVLFITFFGMLGTVLARDFLSFYIFLEIMTVGIYFLIIDNAKKESFPAGFKYVLMMFTGGIFILVAALLLYNLTGTFDFAESARLAHALPRQTAGFIFALFAIGCLIEIGVVPFHIWLPDAHPIAPSPVSALLSGVAIKIGAYGIIRMIFTLDFMSPILIIIGALSMLFGAALALIQIDVKRLLAYSSISQMGYVLLGIGAGTGAGIGGAMFHMLNHAAAKALLFLCMGAIIYATGERELGRLGGLAKRMPVTLITLSFAALAISGIPPFNGFASKAMISESVSGDILLRFVIILTGAGTFAYFLKLFRFAFLGILPEKINNTREVPILMLLPMTVLASACLGIGLFPAQLLKTLISPAAGSALAFDFWSTKILVDAFLIIFLGMSVYLLGLKTGYLGIKKEGAELSFVRYLSLDRLSFAAAGLLEIGCRAADRSHARNLNTHLLWIFLALLFFLFGLRFVL